MKAVIGVDGEFRFESALALLGRLRFRDLHLDLVHVYRPMSALVTAEISGPEPGGFIPARALEQIEETNRARAEETLSKAMAEASLLDSHLHGSVMLGFPTPQLISYSEDNHADLVGVTAHRHGALECFVLGSVCRGLMIGAKQSILIAKGNTVKEGDLKVVVATDHSAYSNRCMDKFFHFAPQGLKEVTVLSVLEPQKFIPFSAEAAKTMIDEEHKDWRCVQSKTEALRQRFAQICESSYARVVIDDPKTQIAETMRETGADLLIMGAQGRGFLERITVGSVSLHQVVSENYPVLVIRQ
jgi:nucleotide-binding universal stress UspA family protein